MSVYILPATTVLLSFLAFITCVRFFFSRQGLYWILPVLMSALFLLSGLQALLQLAETGIALSYGVFNDFYPFLMALLWYLMVTVFHYALNKHVEDNRFENDSRRNRKEAEFLDKAERRRTRHVSKRSKAGRSAILDTLQVPPSNGETEDVD